MKKVLVAVMLIAAVAVSAQDFKPGAGKFGLEVQFNGLTNFGVINNVVEDITGFDLGVDGIISLQGGRLVGTYSITDAIGVRLGFGFNSGKVTNDNGDTGDDLFKTEQSSSEFSIAPGFVYSFAGTERLTPYVGAEIAFAMASDKFVRTVGTNVTTTENGGVAFNKFGFNVFSGFNYYVAKNLYVGAECGLGLASTSHKNTKVTAGGSATELKDKNSDFNFGVNVVPALRLGWAF